MREEGRRETNTCSKGDKCPAKGRELDKRRVDNADDSVRFVDDDERACVSEIACQPKGT